MFPKLQIKLGLLIGLSALLTGATVLACREIGRQYFFDKLYYGKSATYGYSDKIWNVLANGHNPGSIEARIKDLRTVFPDSELKQVLGVTQDKDKPYTILIIGDSVVYGNGIKSEERFSALLEKELSKHRPTKVYTLAQSGDSIIENYYKYLKAETVFSPDITIFGMVNNDFILDVENKYPGQDEFYQQLRKACPQPEKKQDWTDGEMSGEEAMRQVFGPSVDEQYANLCYLKTVAQKLKDKPVLFYSFVPLYEETTEPADSEGWYAWHIMDVYARVLREHSIAVLSPLNLEEFEYVPVSPNENHPDVETNKKYAESLILELTDKPQWKFK